MNRYLLVAVLPALFLSAACERTVIRRQFDGGIVCGENEKLVDGECRFVCDRNADCAADQVCNLFTGECEAAPPDSGQPIPTTPCTVGAERCRSDNRAVESCVDGGVWQTTEACATGGYCLNETCLACQPGLAQCDTTNNKNITVCLNDGSGTRQITCAGAGVCSAGECRECAPNTSRCSPDGTTLQSCTKTNDETLTWKWENAGDNFDATCITQVCETTGGTARCKAPDCFPGSSQCKNTTTQQVCSDTGGWVDQLCSAVPGLSSNAECQSGVCIDECVEAARLKSYFGCEYYTAQPDNNCLASFFKGGTTTGQGNNDSKFAFVVANRSTSAATVTVYRRVNGSEVQVKQVTVQPRTDATTKGLATIYVPWQSVGAQTTNSTGSTGRAGFGYRITSSRPVTVYQFSPLDSLVVTNGTCSNDNQCTADTGGVCKVPTGGTQKQCHYWTYSNDASLLLPAHILGTSHMVVAPDHIKSKDIFGTTSIGFNSQITIVGTANGTQVTVNSTAKLLSGGGVTPPTKGGTTTYTLNQYDVLQFATDNDGAELTCGADPWDPFGSLCRVDNDLTGTVVSSDKPIALFSGASCTIVPNDKAAGDHVEEQIFPFATWGKQFVATRTAPLRKSDTAFASATEAAADYYKIVASCPAATCPNGTTLTLSTPPATTDVIANNCASGTSLSANNCRLMGGKFVLFRSKSSFKVTADQPVAVAQFFAGQQATSSSPAVIQGDPSMLLFPPIEQWRTQYTVLAAPGIRDNYLGLAIDDTKVQEVRVDGVAVTGWTNVANTNPLIKVVNKAVSVGTHTVDVVPKAGQTGAAGAGVTVYGFDEFVSYGYTGGLDLKSIVTGINPGG